MEKSSGELLQESVEKQLEDFSEAAANILFMLYKFDFGEIAGDPLGDLYQQYFDRDTRKALGEFYTPVQVVNYILDAVGYRNIGTRRLLDPSCGSGTFIVEALKRYLSEAKRKAEKHGWAYVLRELCDNPRIVGFDIHPFACLIARTRFMLELIPFFKKAVEQEAPHLFRLGRLPIFRTDSLAIEMTPPELKKQREIAETKGDIAFPVTLPMKIDSESAISVSIILPSWRKIVSHEMLLYNLDEYFCSFQAIFDVVKSVLKWAEEVPEKGLKANLQEYLSNKDFERLASFLKPYADRVLHEVKRIQSEFEDGRLIKSIEDTILAALLKSYLEKQYNFVVGNPPYVRVQRLPAKVKKRYRDVYDSASGKFDIYVLFIERGIDWLTEGGKLGYICSNQYMTRDYGKELRKLILRRTSIKQSLDFGDSGVFKEVTNYPCILVLEKRRKDENEIFCVRVIKQMIDNKGQDVTINNIKENFDKEQFSDESLDIFRIKQDKLTSKTWELMPESERQVFEKIRESSTCLLERLCERIYEGIITGANEVYFVDQTDIDQHSFNMDLLKPIPKGKNVKRWRISWNGRYVIYPHEKADSDVVPIDLGDYPHVEKYLSTHRKRLEKRHYVLKAGKKWYEIWNPRDPTWFATPKIITPNLSIENNFAYDDGITIRGKKCYYYLDHDCYGLALSSSKRSDHLFLLSLLNSKTLEFYLKHVSPFCAGKYFRYMTGYLKRLPIKVPQNDKEKDLSNQIVKKADKILFKSDPKRLVERFPESYLREYQVEGVELDEIQHIINRDHHQLEPFLSGLPEKGYAVYPSEGEDFIWVNTKEKAQYLILALRNRKVKQNDTVKILIPRDNSIVSEILERVRKTIQDLKASQIDEIEEEINELVYQLYGLGEEDKAVIKDFLEKF